MSALEGPDDKERRQMANKFSSRKPQAKKSLKNDNDMSSSEVKQPKSGKQVVKMKTRSKLHRFAKPSNLVIRVPS